MPARGGAWGPALSDVARGCRLTVPRTREECVPAGTDDLGQRSAEDDRPFCIRENAERAGDVGAQRDGVGVEGDRLRERGNRGVTRTGKILLDGPCDGTPGELGVTELVFGDALEGGGDGRIGGGVNPF